MSDNNGTLISVSVLKKSFEKGCEIGPHTLYFIQKWKREKEPSSKLIGDIKINIGKSSKNIFHRECFNILEGKRNKKRNHKPALSSEASYALNDRVASELFRFKKDSKKILVEPTIFSKKLGVVGEPDAVSFSGEFTDILEFKDRAAYGSSKIDELQVEAYMAIFGNEDSNIIEDGLGPSMINEKYKTKVRGFLIYKNGKIMQVQLKNEDLISLRASELLEEIRNYNSIYDLPLPRKCVPDCINALYCKRRSGVLYENTAASPGRSKGKSRAYRARA
jgi:hypothetical protein